MASFAERLIHSVAIAMLVANAALLPAQTATKKPIQDNSFLLEEAYNQEAAVVQHISVLTFQRASSTWRYELTDEWPVVSQKHQLSLTIPVERSKTASNFGELKLNYRLQAIGSGETRLAVTPRLTAIFPTSPDGGTMTPEAALASSFAATPTIILHSNAGATFVASSGEARHADFFAGQSVIWLVTQRVNLMLEGVVTYARDDAGARNAAFTLSPGIRWSHDLPSGLQIVPGIAVPIGLGSNSSQRALLVYLSFEYEMPFLPKPSNE